VVDEGVNYAVQQGVTLSRARTWWFRHNDADHLAQVLATIEAQEKEEG
jgi:7-keto-8-aminopelargonate synthetase-like enzyme